MYQCIRKFSNHLKIVTAATCFVAGSVAADTMRVEVAFNNGIAQKTDNQPEGGVEVSYQIPLKGGDLDGCIADIVEALHPREEGAWGIFDIVGKVTCEDGGFSYNSSGAWDGAGFHASGAFDNGSGKFENTQGRVAQLGGSVADAGDGTLNVAYSLVLDSANK